MAARRKLTKRKVGKLPRIPAGWATTDEDERNRRKRRGQLAEGLRWKALEPSLSPFGRYLVALDDRVLDTGYEVEFRGFDETVLCTCSCPDYRVNGLGTCKHIEALRHALRSKRKRRPKQRVTEILIDRREMPPRLVQADLGDWRASRLPEALALLDGSPVYSAAHARAIARGLETLSASQQRRFRLSASLTEQLEKDHETARLERRLRKISTGNVQEIIGLKLPLYPYQHEGMLHLMTRRRAILADEMGLGKTVQAIAACALLARLGLISRVLVVCPASLKSEWVEQIRLFTDLSYCLVEGSARERRIAYESQALFTLTNYEQILRDEECIGSTLAPQVIVLDEAQRIKNWRTKTAEAIKRLSSDYAFVLTGTPLENRIDEIYSIMQIIDPSVLGPLFRFNRAYYVLNERGAPEGYKNLDRLHSELQPHLLRRRKNEVEGDLPPCSVRTLMVPMSGEQRDLYAGFEAKVARLMSIAKRRPMLPEEMKRLQIALGCMRMTCDTGYILDETLRDAPKLDALDPLLDELLAGEHKIIVFSEWTRMLALLQKRLEARSIGFALHTGSVPQKRRRVEIDRFKRDPDCRVFLSSESGGAGLNLQVADVVVNLDLPWNPAKLAQRIARAWRKHQTRSVQVINFVAEDSIEQGMLGRLEAKQRLADGVLDGGVASMDLPSGRGALVAQLDEIMNVQAVSAAADQVGKSGSGEEGASASTSTGGQVTGVQAAAASAPGMSVTLDGLLHEALRRFDPSLRRVDLLETDSQRCLFAGAISEQAEIQAWFEKALDVARKDSIEQDSMAWRVHVSTPEFIETLFQLSSNGLLDVEGNRHVLIDDGRIVGNASLLKRGLSGEDGLSAAMREAQMKAALKDVIEPHRRTLEASVLLGKSGFAEQGEAMLQPTLGAIGEALKTLESTHELPADLRNERWHKEPVGAEALIAYL